MEKAGIFMFFIGIDIAKHCHEAVVADSSGEVVQKSFRFKNSCAGYNLLLGRVRQITKDRSQLVFCMESTGHYWLALYTRLKKDGYTVHVINPLQSDALRNLYIRQHKTDAKDSLVIADVIRFGRFSETVVPQEIQLALRELCRNRFYMVDSVSDLKRKVVALLDQVFPEFSGFFSSVFVVSGMALLSRYPTPEKLGRANVDTLAGLLLKHSNGYFGKEKATEVKAAARASFGVPDTNGVYSDLISNYIDMIRSVQSKIDMMDKRIHEIMNSLDSPITSITGIGVILGATIISEIGDISRFRSANKLAAFAGIDPTMKQSGNFVGMQNRMSKRGSPYLITNRLFRFL